MELNLNENYIYKPVSLLLIQMQYLVSLYQTGPLKSFKIDKLFV
jgi:hypothetical protein